MAQTIVEKLAQAHLAEGPNRPLRTGDFVSLRPTRLMTHDNTAAVMKKFKAIRAKKIHDPQQLVFALDHDIQNQAEDNQKKYCEIEAFACDHGVDFYAAGTGIGHQIMVERGYVLPGSFVVASDSHSNMYGALGAVGTPVVRTDAATIWATGEFWWQIPRTVQVVLEGELPAGTSGKDVIVTLCGLYNREEVLNAAVEFAGPGVASLSIEARLTIANMTTEWGALVGWFPADAATFAWLRARRAQLGKRGEQRLPERELGYLEAHPPKPDPNAHYAARIVLDMSMVTPHISGPDTVQAMSSLAELEKQRVKIDKAYLVSCVNSRIEDLEEAAAALRGNKVAPHVKFYLAPASRWVQEEAERRGVWQTILESGAIPLPAGCGPCIGLGTGLLQPGEVGISATNRNFKGRMGSREAQCYLASPAVVAASAVAGYICGPEATTPSVIPGERPVVGRESGVPGTPGLGVLGWESRDLHLERRFEDLSVGVGVASETAEILPGFPSHIRGRLVFIPKDNLNTDAIYPGSYTYREDMTPEMMARVVMENHDPQFAATTSAGDVLMGGFNFGTGSSREQAVTALKAKGIPLVIAGSFSQTYLRNAFNNGFLCVEVPKLVECLRGQFAEQARTEKTIIPGDEIEIDFKASTVTWRGDVFHFPALGSVPQSLVIAGGVERLIAQRICNL